MTSRFFNIYLMRMKKKVKKIKDIVPFERIEKSIYLLRGKKIMFDRDLAVLYGVDTRTLNQAVKRNNERFPDDFMFKLTKDEVVNWRSQFVISKNERQGIRYAPYAFTEQGIAMLSSVLNSKRAIAVNIQIIRTFIKLREILKENSTLRKRIDALENKYDQHFRIIFEAIRKLLEEDEEPKRRPIGFKTNNED